MTEQCTSCGKINIVMDNIHNRCKYYECRRTLVTIWEDSLE